MSRLVEVLLVVPHNDDRIYHFHKPASDEHKGKVIGLVQDADGDVSAHVFTESELTTTCCLTKEEVKEVMDYLANNKSW